MNFFGITQLISGIFSLLIGVFVLCQDLKNKVYRSYALFTFSLSGWCTCYFIWQFQTVEEYAIFWLRILMAFMAYIHSLFLHFGLSNINLVESRKKILWFSYSWSTIFAILFLTGAGFADNARQKLFAKFWPDANFFTLLFLVVQIAIVCYGLYCLYSSIHSAEKEKKNQLKYIFIMSALAWAGGLTNWLLWFNIYIPPLGNFLITIYLAVIAYAILRHHLLDINVVFKKSIIYSVSATILSAMYLLIVFSSEQIFRGVTGYNSTPLTIFILIFFAFIFHPLKNQIQRIIDKYFFRGSIEQIDEENVRLRGELQKTEKLRAISTLAAGMAHEIKNPLTSIKTFTEYLPRKHNDPDFINRFNDIVGAEVDKINHIVKQLLEFSRPSELKLKETNINDLLDETLSLLNNDLLKYNIKTQKNYSDIATIDTDPSQIRQVFLNLFLNAMDSIRNDGTIHVVTNQENNGKISITISDTGQGIPKEDIGRIFDPFFTRKDEGTGLGLSVVHGIIEKHGGKITVKSVPEEGTSFVITLPIK
ncbi:MAG: ATP-binding protein [Candidatus Omnitrophota bacterium]